MDITGWTSTTAPFAAAPAPLVGVDHALGADCGALLRSVSNCDLANPGGAGGRRRRTSGKTFGYNGGFIRVQVGREVTADQLHDDWVLVHEMTHLALPDVGDDHGWLSEGLAVYVEGVARVQAGNRTQSDVWSEQMRSMPRGLPQPGDRGLDHTHTWGRTYWGGAMFCLLADVEIHRRTRNRFGLQDAMRAIARDERRAGRRLAHRAGPEDRRCRRRSAGPGGACMRR